MAEPIQIPAVIEHVGPCNPARRRHPVAIQATGISAFDARHQLETLLAAHLGRPVEGLALQADAHSPWIGTAGSVPDDTLTDEWLESVAEYRRQFAAVSPVG